MKARFGILVALGIFAMTACTPSSFEIYIVRHAEKAETEVDNRDPLLSECGQQRAEALVNWFAHKNIQTIYATQYQRTQLTGRPLAEDRDLRVEEYDASDSQFIAETVLARQQNTLIVGHSNTAPVIANLIAGTELELLDESEFDRLYQIRVQGGEVTLQSLEQNFTCTDVERSTTHTGQ